MSEIYLIYSKDDIDKVRDIITPLTAAGHSIWPPADSLFIEADIEVFERKLQEANCVIACWTTKSLSSSFLKTSAKEAEIAGKLIEIDLDDIPNRSITGIPEMAYMASQISSPNGWDVLIDQIQSISPVEDITDVEIISQNTELAIDKKSHEEITPLQLIENPPEDDYILPPTRTQKIKNAIKIGLLVSAVFVTGTALYAFNLKPKLPVEPNSNQSATLSKEARDVITDQLAQARIENDPIALRAIMSAAPDTGYSEKAGRYLKELEERIWENVLTSNSSSEILEHIESYRIDFPDGNHTQDAKELEKQHRIFIADAEDFLKHLGFDPGAPDGIITQETSNAVTSFQSRFNLEINGKLRMETYEALTKIAGYKIAKDTKLGSLYLTPQITKLETADDLDEIEGTSVTIAPTAKTEANKPEALTIASSTSRENDLDAKKLSKNVETNPTTTQAHSPSTISTAKNTNTSTITPKPTPNTSTQIQQSKQTILSPTPPSLAKTPQQFIQDCAECPQLVVIPEGRFVMGDMSGNAQEDRIPVRKVIFNQAFALASFETTFAEWDACVDDGKCRPIENDMGWGRGNRPVIGTSWHDAKQYTQWLSDKTGQKYRLPSEAEWEYAARAGSSTTYTFGEDLSELCQYGNGADLSTQYPWRNTACSDNFGKKTAPVGTFRANKFGLYDIHGNVWEWVEDCWHPNYNNAPTNGSAWTKQCNNNTKVLRGGSFSVQPDYLGSSNRYAFPADQYMPFFGFRVARALSE
ncbi:SUMF1/EgtB/PvdO family nonheme iron enzyme [Hirschia baltica]|uniref:TIR domain-containing protein n=1 Tax=Hirschia baltica (strain ATCC 49814 / DSM 5838 / IFAM 1418) TaxID=582402 RepID=C6XK34_HIRBI|nr:SUMF1/EgtB/PvdO family nonheme iron enzyme [Hirschia baltica]ACT59479.1 protein of unknown function DUF323 [Hirschia baltica ATCC 49814]